MRGVGGSRTGLSSNLWSNLKAPLTYLALPLPLLPVLLLTALAPSAAVVRRTAVALGARGRGGGGGRRGDVPSSFLPLPLLVVLAGASVVVVLRLIFTAPPVVVFFVVRHAGGQGVEEEGGGGGVEQAWRMMVQQAGPRVWEGGMGIRMSVGSGWGRGAGACPRCGGAGACPGAYKTMTRVVEDA